MFSDRAGLRTCRQASGDAGADVRMPFSEQAGQVHGMISTTSYPDVSCMMCGHACGGDVSFKTIMQRFVRCFLPCRASCHEVSMLPRLPWYVGFPPFLIPRPLAVITGQA